MRSRSVIVTRRGGPEALQVVERELRAPRRREVRIRVQAAPVCAPDVTARYGRSPLVPRPPFTPGYAVVGVVDGIGPDVHRTAVGDNVAALLGYGGYAEHVLVPERQLISVPSALDAAQVAPLILNYLVAYQVMHRRARVQEGDRALIIGASGGVGTAFLQLGRLAGLTMYGVASGEKLDILRQYGAVPIDYRTQDFVRVIRRAEPDGLNAVFDGMAGDHFARGFSVLRRGGVLVGYGNPGSYRGMLRVLGQTLWFALLPNGKRAVYYSTGASRLNRRPFLEDWSTLFGLLESGRIKPIIEARFPILEAARANALLEGGQVVGNVVLVAPELLRRQAVGELQMTPQAEPA